MKKFIFIVSLIVSISLIYTITINVLVKMNYISNTVLLYENYILNQKHRELEKRIAVVESQLDSINYYDNYIYSQIFGINIVDSTEIEINLTDSLYRTNSLDNKILFLSEYVSHQLTQVIDVFNITKKNENVLNSYPNIFPINSINDTIEITSKFGWRKHPIFKKILFHKGIDISAKMNSNVYSSMNGIVNNIEYSNRGYGNNIIITNEYGYKVRYAHLTKKFFVKKNQKVKKGELIALVGNSGLSTAPHLHYEIYKYEIISNPLNYIISITNAKILDKYKKFN